MTTHICPVCAGPQFTDHPGGPLVFQHRITCDLLPALDKTQAHEFDQLVGVVIRDPNPSERALAVSMDHELSGTAFKIRCQRVTASIINRTIIPE
jgi:hypothetical protein